MKQVKLSDVRDDAEPDQRVVTVEAFRVGDALSTAFSTLFANLPSFSLIGILAFMPIVALSFWVSGDTALIDFDVSQIGWQGVVASMFLMTVFSQIAHAAIVYGAVSHLSGQQTSFLRMISGGVNVALPVFGVSVLVGLGTMFGYVLLIIPGIIISIIFAVAIPAVVAENKGVIAALERSAELTKGSRWEIFWATVVMGVVQGVFNGVVGFVEEFAGTGDAQIAMSFLVAAVTVGVSTGMTGALAAAIYTQLRENREGTPVDEIAEVFA